MKINIIQYKFALQSFVQLNITKLRAEVNKNYAKYFIGSKGIKCKPVLRISADCMETDATEVLRKSTGRENQPARVLLTSITGCTFYIIGVAI